jgi:hypothetical protein
VPSTDAWASLGEQLAVRQRTAVGAHRCWFYVCLPTPRDIAAIQQQVASDMPQVHVSCDTATLEHISDGKHLTAAAERQAGQMLGTDIAKEFYKEQNP